MRNETEAEKLKRIRSSKAVKAWGTFMGANPETGLVDTKPAKKAHGVFSMIIGTAIAAGMIVAFGMWAVAVIVIIVAVDMLSPKG